MVGRIVQDASVVMLGRLVSIAGKGALVLLLTRYLLRPSEYGLLFLTISVLGVAMLFANLGFSKAGARYITQFRESEPHLVSIILRKTFVYNCVTIAVVAVGVFLARDVIADVVGEPAIGGLLVFGAAYLVFKSLKGTTKMVFQGFGEMEWATTVDILTNVLLVIFVPAFLLLGFGLGGAISGYALSYAVVVALGVGVIYRRWYTGIENEERESEVSSRLLRYSVPLTLTKGANTIDSRVDTILLSVFHGPTAIAFYTLGKQIADFVIVPAQSLGFAISPTYGEKKANGDLTTAARRYEQSFIYTMAFYGPAAAGIVFVARPAVTLVFGSVYAGAGPVLQIFSLFVLVRALDKITNDALDFLGRARARAVAKGALAVANFGLNLVLIPRFGVIGATVATVTTYSVLVAAELFIIADELPLDPVNLSRGVLVVAGITAGMSVVVYPLADAIDDTVSLVGVVAAGGAVWLVLTVLTGLVNPSRIASAIT